MRPSAPRPRIRTSAAALLTAALLAGCGDDDETVKTVTTLPVGTEAVAQLTKAEAAVIPRTQRSVAAYCRRVAAGLAQGEPPSVESFEQVNANLDELGALAASKPDASGPEGTSPRLALGDIAENLEGTNCDSRLVRRIDDVLAAIP